MSPETTQFLVNLSHKWAGEVMCLPIIFGAATYWSGKRLAYVRATGSGGLRLARAARYASSALLAVSLFAFLLSFLHYGCAILMGQMIQCKDNERLLADAMLMYTQDNDNRFPASSRWSEAVTPYLTKSSQWADHRHSEDPFKCPGATSPAGYGMNDALDQTKIYGVDASASTVLLFDAEAPIRSFAGGMKDLARTRHNGMPNLAFADGHVKAVNRSTLSDSVWMPSLPRVVR